MQQKMLQMEDMQQKMLQILRNENSTPTDIVESIENGNLDITATNIINDTLDSMSRNGIQPDLEGLMGVLRTSAARVRSIKNKMNNNSIVQGQIAKNKLADNLPDAVEQFLLLVRQNHIRAKELREEIAFLLAIITKIHPSTLQDAKQDANNNTSLVVSKKTLIGMKNESIQARRQKREELLKKVEENWKQNYEIDNALKDEIKLIDPNSGLDNAFEGEDCILKVMQTLASRFIPAKSSVGKTKFSEEFSEELNEEQKKQKKSEEQKNKEKRRVKFMEENYVQIYDKTEETKNVKRLLNEDESNESNDEQKKKDVLVTPPRPDNKKLDNKLRM